VIEFERLATERQTFKLAPPHSILDALDYNAQYMTSPAHTRAWIETDGRVDVD